MKIDTNNTRRFRHEDGVAVLAIYDTRKGFNLYAEVCGAQADEFDLSTVRSYFNDEIVDLR